MLDTAGDVRQILKEVSALSFAIEYDTCGGLAANWLSAVQFLSAAASNAASIEDAALAAGSKKGEIGRASCRERVF